MRKKECKASLTIEMSFLVPVILFLFMGIVMIVFYYHDKNILNGAAYETVVLGSSKVRTREGISEEELESYLRERIAGKCIFLTFYSTDVSIQEEEIQVDIEARKNGYGISVQKKAAVTEPEKKIRDIRRLDSKNGEKNND